jgi:hypothetical protein
MQQHGKLIDSPTCQRLFAGLTFSHLHLMVLIIASFLILLLAQEYFEWVEHDTLFLQPEYLAELVCEGVLATDSVLLNFLSDLGLSASNYRRDSDSESALPDLHTYGSVRHTPMPDGYYSGIKLTGMFVQSVWHLLCVL